VRRRQSICESGLIFPFLPSAELIKRGFDSLFGACWHCVVGEEFGFNLDHEANMVYYLLYGSFAIIVWKVSHYKAKSSDEFLFFKCGSLFPWDVNHVDDPATKDKIKARLAEEAEREAKINKISREKYFSEKI